MANGTDAAPESTATPDAPAEEKQPAKNGGASLSIDKNGDLATANGSGFEPGARYEVGFLRPDDRLDTTAAFADENGNLQARGRCYVKGKYSVSVSLDGNEVASAKFTA